MDLGSVELPSPFHCMYAARKQVNVKLAYFVHFQAKTNVLFIVRNKKQNMPLFLLVDLIERTRVEGNRV